MDTDITSMIAGNKNKSGSFRNSNRDESGGRKSFARSLSTKLDASRTSVSAAMSSEGMSKAKRRLLDALPMVLLVVFVMLPAIARSIFSAWDCMPYSAGPDGAEVLFLRVDESVECDSTEHQQIVALAIILVIIWPVGAQVLFFYVLYINRKVLREDRVNALAKSTKFLTGGYKPHVYFWEVVELARRLAVSGFVVLIPYEFIMWRILFALFISMPIFAATVLILPFRRIEDNYLSLANQCLLIIAFIICILIRIVNEELLNNKQKTAIVGYAGAEGLFLTLCGIILLFCVLLLCTYCYKVYGEYLRLVNKKKGVDANAQSATMFVFAGFCSIFGLIGGGLIGGLTGAVLGAFFFAIIGAALGSLSWKHVFKDAGNMLVVLGLKERTWRAKPVGSSPSTTAVKFSPRPAPTSQSV